MAHTYIEARQEAERRVVTKFIELALQHGFTLHSVSDGEERHKTTTLEQALEHVFSVDESWVYFTPAPTSPSPVRHCIYIVLGNEGWDAIADHSLGQHGRTGDPWTTVTEAHDAWLDEEYP